MKNKMRFHNVDQNSDEWFDLRAGKVTSSQMAKVMANLGKGFGEPARKYSLLIALERHNNKRIYSDNYMSSAMKRGHELEPIARELYEVERMVTVKNGGFIEDGQKGDSPDGIVKDGVIEIKSVEAGSHWKVREKESFDPAYKWQIHFHIWMNEAKFCDFISYCPDFPEDKQLYIFRVDRDEVIIDQMKSRLEEFEVLVEENIKALKK